MTNGPPPIMHVEMAGPVNRLSIRLTLGERHCSGIMAHESGGTWSLRWTTGEHNGEVRMLALDNARWHSALKRAIVECENRMVRRHP